MRRLNLQNYLQAENLTELDLAPLLSIMVKLIPVLLLSTAFVQVSIIETDLPLVVKNAIEQNQTDQNKPELTVTMDQSKGFIIDIDDPHGKSNQKIIELNSNQRFDFVALNQALIKIKQQYPSVFKINLNPQGDISYQDIVKTMDCARKPLDKSIKFQFQDKSTSEFHSTDFMFPEIIFSNILSG